MKTKLCRGPCGRELSLKRFSKRQKNGKWYPASECLECMRIRARIKAGKSAEPQYRHVSAHEKVAYRRLHDAGHSLRAIARRFGRSDVTVAKWVGLSRRFDAPWGSNPGEMVITRALPGERLSIGE